MSEIDHSPCREEVLRAEIERLRAENGCLSDVLDTNQRLRARNAELLAAGNAAFLAMCAYRDGGDEECFQDAIDELGAVITEAERK